MSHHPGHLVVLGATGVIGGAVVEAAVQVGRPVIAVGRNPDALAALCARHPGAAITPVAASVASDADAAALAVRLRELDRPLAGVVAAICGDCGRGRVLDQPAEFLRKRLDEDLLPHLFAARHLLRLLAGQGQGGYVLLGGPGAGQPWAGYGHRSIGAAALRMLARVLHDEARAFDVRVQLLAVDSPARTDANARHACGTWPSAASIARRALALAVQRDGDREASQAIVPHAAQPLGHDLWSDDIDHAPASPVRAAGPQSPPAPARETAAQETGRRASLLPARCLQDARTLLRRLAPVDPNSNSNQEASPR
ncbi:MAG TPA: SDR family NAD(P)-dependent oxidoreductase [Luteimonas sp.]|nr:SDR family NAD(P)-dependent oxidoreductase [Luteimonas sp.]